MKWIRKQIGWIAAVAVGGMILWLVVSAATLQEAQERPAGSLFGQPVRAQEYNRALEAVTRDALLRSGDRYRQEVTDAQLQQQAWERLLLLTEARRLGLSVSDREVIEEIRKAPIFQTESGQFDRQGYESVIRYSLGTTSRAFEEKVREDLAIQKLFDRALGTPAPTESEILQEFHRREEKFRVILLSLPHQALAQEIADSARQDPVRLKRAAKQLKLKIQETGLFRRSDSVPKLGTTGGVLGAALELKPGEISQPIQLSNQWLIVQLKERRPADESTLESVRADIEKGLSNQKRLQAYFTWQQDLRKRADLKPRESANR